MSEKEPVTNVGTDNEPVVNEKNVDVTLNLTHELDESVPPLTPQKQRQLKRKLYLRLFTLLCFINLWLFIDKATLAYASLLGILQEDHVSDNQFNDLYTIFYTGYIIAQLPGAYLMQRLPLGKFVSGAIFLWSVLVFLHCTAQNFGDLVPLRFFLGMAEAALVPAMEITFGMFFTPGEYAEVQPLFWISCVGCTIPAGFIAYGLLYIHSAIKPWKYFMIITGGVSFLISVFCFFFYPNNPAEARLFSLEDRIQIIRKVHQATRSSIQQKTFKIHQARETLRDPVSWLFLLAAFFLMLANNLQYQQNLLFLKIGVDDLGATLVSATGGGVAVVSCLVGWLLLRFFPDTGAYIAAFFCLPSIAGAIGMIALPWNHEIGLLACLILAANTFGVCYIIMLGWASSSSAGYTKKLLRNVFFMVGYGIGNIIAPQIWQSSNSPRYYSAWIVQIVLSWVGTPTCLLTVRWILSRRNSERRQWIGEQNAMGEYGHGLIERQDGEKEVVDVAFLDLTDLENKYFIYPL